MTTDRLPGVEPDIRDLLAEVRALVDHITSDMLRIQLRSSSASKSEALAASKSMVTRLQPLVAAHDALAAALNKARPDAQPVISLSTEEPA